MFEYVALKNFKSLGNVKINLLDRYNNPKKMILVYGENGIGKTNLASAFIFFSDTLETMNVRDFISKLLSEKPDALSNNEVFKRYIESNYKDLEALIKENKTVSSTDPMVMEFGFRINGKSGKYLLEMNDTKIIHERLEYTLVQRRGAYFDLTPDKVTINTRIFKDKSSYQAIKNACDMYWGKHSFLSIVMHESNDKADHYIKDQIDDNFSSIISFFSSISCSINFGSNLARGAIALPSEMQVNFDKGRISLSDEETLNRTEKMLDTFLKATNPDIDHAFYKRTYDKDRIHYQLVITKKIAGKLRDIDFSLESTGTQALIQQLPYMLVAVNGSFAVIDEFETGLHDVLVNALAESLYGCIEGQLLLTTHNTKLMESKCISKDSFYVISENNSGEKEIQCILHYNNKLSNANSIRNQYFNGKYNRIPEQPDIDFHSLLDILQNNGNGK